MQISINILYSWIHRWFLRSIIWHCNLHTHIYELSQMTRIDSVRIRLPFMIKRLISYTSNVVNQIKSLRRFIYTNYDELAQKYRPYISGLLIFHFLKATHFDRCVYENSSNNPSEIWLKFYTRNFQANFVIDSWGISCEFALKCTLVIKNLHWFR